MGLLSQHGQSDLLSGATDFVLTRGCQASSSSSFRRYSPNKLVYGNAGGRLPRWRLGFPLKYAALNFWEMQEFQLWRSPWGFLCSFWLSCVYLGLGHTSPMQLEGYVMDADCYLLNVKISDHVTLHGESQNRIKFCRLPRAFLRHIFPVMSGVQKTPQTLNNY